ncbi:hypothetical protein M2103_002007 [Ereboglobus sp. PH5-5]|uniref:hypothetical protein n=1 Tax=unclassified Ereboglobus TaxID=2626932 RepID=UPI002405AC37|nr:MULTISPECIES: hypothetical protein [unclassified Ereboglobus]MDF9827296.1 hypothetical protein [Ereboglobus sp. PH5-10]MDF9833774.1 hypothetical protein [Ereboglobus sp. PH5-5]
MLYGIVIIILGLLAIPSLVLAKKPNAKELFDKVAPYMGWIGVVALIWGIWTLYRVIRSLSLLSSGTWGIITWVIFLAISIVEIGLGFIMGYNLVAKHAISKSPEAQAKGQEMLAKVAPYQGKLGIAAIITGIIYIVLHFI